MKKKIIKNLLLSTILLNFIFLPLFSLARVIEPYPSPHRFYWLEPILYSFFLYFLFLFIWFISPFGGLFLILSLCQFLFWKKKKLILICWILQISLFLFFLLISLILGFFVFRKAFFSYFAEERIAFTFGFLGTFLFAFFLKILLLLSQFLYQRK